MASMIAPPSSRRFLTELSNLIGKRVEVVLIDGRKYVGRLLGFEHPEMNLVLSDVKVDDQTIPRLFIMGRVIAEIRAYETTIFDPREFADYVAKKLGLRPDAIRVYPDAGVVMIYNSIRVTAEGVEGAGPLAAKVNYVLKEYLEAKKRGEPLR
ncbi:Lsm family RNA-binding protein [Pyrofollis japonicus]|uniref:Lsm family RNA-binding protein n=1 Tax=Pyrofollis japonicus TaxID=3060460 RepID=UPI00295ACA0A|nr:Lsm family RNA-binding protein [Pyrofollis japonicus]BEP18588.1 Lsm family RNA-binding protein [Pyrofollis japonicus]